MKSQNDIEFVSKLKAEVSALIEMRIAEHLNIMPLRLEGKYKQIHDRYPEYHKQPVYKKRELIDLVLDEIKKFSESNKKIIKLRNLIIKVTSSYGTSCTLMNKLKTIELPENLEIKSIKSIGGGRGIKVLIKKDATITLEDIQNI